MDTAHALHLICANCHTNAGGVDLTGLATLALALVTTALAYATFRAVSESKKATQAAVKATNAAVDEARATENLVAQSSEQLRRSYLPILLPVNVATTVSSGGGAVESRIQARIENVGTGPALNVAMDIIWRDDEHRHIAGGEYRRAVVPSGGVDAFSIKYAEQVPSAFVVRLSFRD